MDWIRRVSDYRTLTGKREQLHRALGAHENRRLEELNFFFCAEGDPHRAAFQQRQQRRVTVHIPATIEEPSGARRRAILGDLSGDGFFLVTSDPLLPIGSHTLVRVADPMSGEEWRFVAEVVRHDSRATGMGVRLLGLPISLHVGTSGRHAA